MRLEGEYYRAGSSGSTPVTMTITPDGSIRLEGEGFEQLYWLRETQVSDRLGSLVRTFAFDDGALCEVADNDAVDEFLGAYGFGAGGARVHGFERRWSWAVMAALALVLGIAFYVRFGVPAMASALAAAMPAEIDDRIGRQGLELMDRIAFAPTRLEEPVRERVQQRFVALTAVAGGDEAYELVFRAGRDLGPNAFALPSGTIVVTDELIELARNDDQIAAVLAHEIGHVRGRHTLRLILQDSITAAVLAVVIGDITSLSALAGAVPTVLMQAHYSRAFETEADAYALELMQSTGIDPQHFADILRLIEQAHEGDGPPVFISTHPTTEQRARRFED